MSPSWLPAPPENADSAENWQNHLWLNCKPVGFQSLCRNNKSYTWCECSSLLGILRYMKGSFSFFHCSTKRGTLPSEWTRTKLTSVLCWAEGCTNTKVDVKQAQITTCARSATIFRLNLPCRIGGHVQVHRPEKFPLFQEKMEEKMLQSSRSHPSRDSCTGRIASSPAGEAS